MSPQADALSTRIMRFLLPQMLSTHFVIFISKLSVPGSEKVTLHAEGIPDDTAIRGRKNCRYSSTNSVLCSSIGHSLLKLLGKAGQQQTAWLFPSRELGIDNAAPPFSPPGAQKEVHLPFRTRSAGGDRAPLVP